MQDVNKKINLAIFTDLMVIYSSPIHITLTTDIIRHYFKSYEGMTVKEADECFVHILQSTSCFNDDFIPVERKRRSWFEIRQ